MSKFKKRVLGLCSTLLTSFICEPSTEAAVLYKANDLFYKVIKYEYSLVENGKLGLMGVHNHDGLKNKINEILFKSIKNDLANGNEKGRIINDNIAEIENGAVCTLCKKKFSTDGAAYCCHGCGHYYHVACACRWVFTRMRVDNKSEYIKSKMKEHPVCVNCRTSMPRYTPELIIPERMYSKVKQELGGGFNQIKEPQLHPEVKKLSSENSLNQIKEPQLHPEIKKTENSLNQIKSIQINQNQNVILNEQVNSKDGHLSGNNLLNYIKTPQINEKIANIVNKYVSQFGKKGECPAWVKSEEVKQSILDMVGKGVLPVRYVKMSDLNSLDLKPNGKAKFFAELGQDCWKIHEKSYNDNSMAVVCSQFNALEAVSPFLSSVDGWYGDGTQGPAMSLRAPVDALHRYIACTKGKLNDSMSDVFNKFPLVNKEVVKYAFGSCKLYQNGYLNLDGAYKELNDEQKSELVNHIKDNINDFKLNFQWVHYMDGKTNQIQVFAAAPSLQRVSRDKINKLNENDKKFITDICKTTQVHQFEMIGKLAAARSCALSGKRFNLHVWIPGAGVFKNPEESIYEAVKTLLNFVKDYNIDVYLHRRTANDLVGRVMGRAMKELGLSYSKHI